MKVQSPHNAKKPSVIQEVNPRFDAKGVVSDLNQSMMDEFSAMLDKIAELVHEQESEEPADSEVDLELSETESDPTVAPNNIAAAQALPVKSVEEESVEQEQVAAEASESEVQQSEAPSEVLPIVKAKKETSSEAVTEEQVAVTQARDQVEAVDPVVVVASKPVAKEEVSVKVVEQEVVAEEVASEEKVAKISAQDHSAPADELVNKPEGAPVVSEQVAEVKKEAPAEELPWFNPETDIMSAPAEASLEAEVKAAPVAAEVVAAEEPGKKSAKIAIEKDFLPAEQALAVRSEAAAEVFDKPLPAAATESLDRMLATVMLENDMAEFHGLIRPVLEIPAKAIIASPVLTLLASAGSETAQQFNSNGQPFQHQQQQPQHQPFQNVTGIARAEVATESARGSALERMTRQQSTRTMERVESVLKEAAKSKDGKSISLRLDPPSLGAMKVDVSMRDGVLHARLQADSAQVNQMLRERAFELQQMLRGLGLEVDSVSVSVGSHESSIEYREGRWENKKGQGFRSLVDEFVDGEEANAGRVESDQGQKDHWVA